MKREPDGNTRHEAPTLYVIYDCPRDFPQQFACRIWCGEQLPQLFTVADSLEQIQKTLPSGLRCLGSFTFEQVRRGLLSRRILRHQDDPVNVEVWF